MIGSVSRGHHDRWWFKTRTLYEFGVVFKNYSAPVSVLCNVTNGLVIEADFQSRGQGWSSLWLWWVFPFRTCLTLWRLCCLFSKASLGENGACWKSMSIWVVSPRALHSLVRLMSVVDPCFSNRLTISLLRPAFSASAAWLVSWCSRACLNRAPNSSRICLSCLNSLSIEPLLGDLLGILKNFIIFIKPYK